MPYRDAILHACTHWTGYDQQVEGTRTTYLRDVLDATGHERAFVKPILAALKTSTDRRDATQLVFLALSLAKDGYDEARTALYEAFDRNDTEEPFLGYDAIIRLDGLDGLLHVADRVGRALLDSQDDVGGSDWVLASAVHEAEEQFGRKVVRQALGRGAAQSEHVQAYVEAVRAIEAEAAEQRATESGWRSRSDGSDNRSYEQLSQQILDASPPWSVRRPHVWGQNASADDLARAAADLLAEQDEGRLRAYLQIFRRRAFPLEIDRLLALVRHQNDRIAYSAADALSRMAHPRVRALALDIIADPSLRGWHMSRGIDLLRSNFETGDAQVFAQLLEEPCEEMGYHSIGFAIVDVLEENLIPEVAPVLRLLYERGPCTNCRKKAVELLRHLAMLPAWLLNECRYDAGHYLRDAAEAWARGEEPADD